MEDEILESSIKRKLFGKEVEIAVWDAKEPIASDIMTLAYNEGLRLQKIFNMYDENSELSKLNRERRLEVSTELLEVIKIALKFCELTDGEYDISFGKIIMQRKNGNPEDKINCNYEDILVTDNIIQLAHKDVLIDLGSCAKGYIAQKMAEFLKSEGIINGLIDARGDICIFGDMEHTIDIAHPRSTNKNLKSIRLKNTNVATSGDYNQYIGDYDKSHIINKKNIISVTVVASALLVAELYASALFVCTDNDKIMKMHDANDVMAMTVDKNMNIKYYNGFEKFLI